MFLLPLRRPRRLLTRWLSALPLAALSLACLAQESPRLAPGDRLPATGGVSQLEGAGGGGLVPWALITGYGTRDQLGGSAYFTSVDTGDFRLDSSGLALGLFDRVELSYARQHFNLGDTVPGEKIDMDVFGAKWRLLGDAVFDQDRWWPQLALGVQYKRNQDYALVPKALGAQRDADWDAYLAATKVWLDGPFGRSLLVNLSLRATRGNQMGLLGFGGDRSDRYKLMPEASLGIFLTDRLVLGAEYRTKPDNLSAFKEDDFQDAFLAWFPTKWVSVTAAWAGLGNVANKPDQQGWYLSVQLSH